MRVLLAPAVDFSLIRLPQKQSHERRAIRTPIDALRGPHLALKRVTAGGALELENSALADEACERANGECAPAEAEQEDPVARIVNTTPLLVELAHVATERP